MVVICPTCNKDYKIPDSKIPQTQARARCKNCGETMVIEATGAVWAETSLVGPMNAPQSMSSEGGGGGIPLDHDLFTAFPQLQSISPKRVAFEEVFSTNKKGGYRNRKNKFKVKILLAVSQVLEKILNDGERVMRMGKGTAYYPSELIFGNGWLTIMYNHYAILATNQRILLININSRMKDMTHYLFQVSYEDIKNVKRGLLFGSMVLHRMRGKRRVFTQMKRHISKELRDFIMERKEDVGAVPEKILENICPSCFVPLENGLTHCPSCEAPFKEPKKASLRSLLLPGLGDFYLGHRALGVLELMGSIMVWAYALVLIFFGQESGLYVAIFLLLLYNGMDAVLTYFMAKKGYMLA